MCGNECCCSGLCRNGPILSSRVKVGSSKLVPGENGCIAVQPIEKGDLIGEYRGKRIITKREKELLTKKKSEYLCSQDYEGKFFVDAMINGSAVTRANHSKKNPNSKLVSKFVRVENNSRVSEAVFLVADKSLDIGEEVLWNYGAEYDTSGFYA